MYNQIKSILFCFVFALSSALFMSCETSHYSANSWQDLNHSRDLDKLKGKRLKPIQKNVSKTFNY